MTSRLKQSPRPSSSSSLRSCPFIDRHKILAVVCEKHPELQLPDDFDDWIKEIERLDDYAERMMEEVKELQKSEHQCIRTNNYRQLRQTQVRIREQLRKLRISVEQKSEVNNKIERFFDEFNAKLPVTYAHVDAVEPENLTLDENRTLQTPEIKQKNYEILQRQHEFAAEQLKVEQTYIAANEANEPGKNTNPLPSVSAPVTRGAGRKKVILRKSESPEEPPPKQRIHKTAEQLAAKREERVRAQKAKEEQRKTAEEIQKILEQESDYPKRRAAATAAVGAIHNLQIQQARIPIVPQKVSPKMEKTVRKAYTRRSGEKKTIITTTTTTSITPVPGKPSRKSTAKEEEEETYCTCKQVSYGEMIACDNDDCEIIWFHFGCVNLKIKPKKGNKWYCQQCRGDKSTVMKNQ
ncbi:hypothetical protein FO519_009401 [Halicephalobus sp. NKZ332]|nr:hypothetical protein FO519_009401 [Halicephalobus sp. NKZ332]